MAEDVKNRIVYLGKEKSIETTPGKEKEENDNIMKTLCRTQGMQTSFVISDLDPIYNDAVQELFFTPHEDGFAKTFPANTPHLDIFYQHFTQTLEELILQTARIHPALWEQALLAFLQKVEQQDIQWYLAGSAALAVRGLDVAPRDLDLIADDAGAQALGDLLFDTLDETADMQKQLGAPISAGQKTLRV